MVGNLQDPVGQFTDRRGNGTGQADQESKSNQDTSHRDNANPQQCLVRRTLGYLAFPVDRRHIQTHDIVECHPDTLYSRIVQVPVHRLVLCDQMRRRHILVDLRDILLLQIQVLFKLRTCLRIVLDPFEGIQHPTRIKKRIIIIRQDILRVGRHIRNILHSQPAQQNDHRKQKADPEGQFRFYFQS